MTQHGLKPSPQSEKDRTLTDDTNGKLTEDSSGSPVLRERSIVVRVVTAIALLFTAWHLFASFLWIAPVTPLRELVPGNALASYMLPMFGQSWSVFAPSPINGDFSLKVRAMVTDVDGNMVETEWVDAAQIEIHSMHTHNFFPPRASTAGLQQASALKSAWEELNADQQETVSLGFFKGSDWSERLSYLLAQNAEGGAAQDYFEIEQRTTAYATQVARAVWGNDVQKIQFQVSRQNVVPFAQRHDPDVDRPPVQIVSTGWRGVLDFPGQSNERFAEIFKPMYDSYQRKSQ